MHALLSFIVVIGIVIFVHELGHFLAAKGVGMRATRFSVGFGPALVSRRRGDTEYRLAAQPLGGYVKIVGMARPRAADLANVGEAVDEAARTRPIDRPDRLGPAYQRMIAALGAGEESSLTPLAGELQAALDADADLIDPERREWCQRELTRVTDDVDPRCYWRADVWRRVVVIAAGPFANIVTAVVILTAFFWSGPPQFKVTKTVDQIANPSPAHQSGLTSGDLIVRVNGKAVTSSNQVSDAIQKPGTITLVVRRAGELKTLTPVTPQKGRDGRRYLGFGFTVAKDGYLQYGLGGSVRAAWSDLWYTTSATFRALGDIVTGGQRDQISSPVGIVQQSQTSLNEGVYPRLLALISLSLAIFNLLPFLPLDGGHILFALIEFFRKRPLAREVYERVSLIGIVAMLMLFAIGLSNDVTHITSGPRIGP
jgi:regulator of sigma E protease